MRIETVVIRPFLRSPIGTRRIVLADRLEKARLTGVIVRFVNTVVDDLRRDRSVFFDVIDQVDQRNGNDTTNEDHPAENGTPLRVFIGSVASA